ncbi:MAG TPA: hypothetical protein VMZ02_09745 [Candidatus Limnocylindrales bacterium]|nr:hypothetical protein [Candidatus Limnocylindrales bacterium]
MKTTAIISVTLLVSCLGASVGFSDSGSKGSSGPSSGSKGKSGNLQLKLEAQMEPLIVAPATSPIAPDAEGEAKYRKQIQKGTIKTERFEARVKIPFPSPALGIIDQASAQNADIQILLSSATTPTVAYASCALDLSEIETELEDGVTKTYAEYKVDVRRELRNSSYRQRQIHGICDVAPATVSIEAGTPAPVENDIVTAVLVIAPVPPAIVPTLTPIVAGTVELD